MLTSARLAAPHARLSVLPARRVSVPALAPLKRSLPCPPSIAALPARGGFRAALAGAYTPAGSLAERGGR